MKPSRCSSQRQWRCLRGCLKSQFCHSECSGAPRFLPAEGFRISGWRRCPERLFEKCLAVKTATTSTKSACADDSQASVLEPAAAGFVRIAATLVAKATKIWTFQTPSEMLHAAVASFSMTFDTFQTSSKLLSLLAGLGLMGILSETALAVCPAPNQKPTAADCIALFKDVTRWLDPSLKSCRAVTEARYIPSGAMLPTLQINDRLIIDKTAYCSQAPQRGDLIVFQPTATLRAQNFKDAFIKRIIGLPGERLEIKQNKVYVNGKPLQEPYISEPPAYVWGSQIVPPNQYFVLGDNRNNSYDSHYWGFVPRELIIGQAVWRFYPFDRTGSLER